MAAGTGLDAGRADAGRTLPAFRNLAADELVHDKRVGLGSGVFGGTALRARRHPAQHIRFCVPDATGAIGFEIARAVAGHTPAVNRDIVDAEKLGNVLGGKGAVARDICELGAQFLEGRFFLGHVGLLNEMTGENPIPVSGS